MSKDPTINIAELERLARAATPGPWKFHDLSSPDFFRYEVRGPERFDSNGNDSNFFHFTEHRGDAAFIASANPQTILTLIAALREAKGALQDACCCSPGQRSALGFVCSTCDAISAITAKVEGL